MVFDRGDRLIPRRPPRTEHAFLPCAPCRARHPSGPTTSRSRLLDPASQSPQSGNRTSAASVHQQFVLTQAKTEDECDGTTATIPARAMLKKIRYVQRSRATSLRNFTAGPSLMIHPHNKTGNIPTLIDRAERVGIAPNTCRPDRNSRWPCHRPRSRIPKAGREKSGAPGQERPRRAPDAQ